MSETPKFRVRRLIIRAEIEIQDADDNLEQLAMSDEVALPEALFAVHLPLVEYVCSKLPIQDGFRVLRAAEVSSETQGD